MVSARHGRKISVHVREESDELNCRHLRGCTARSARLYGVAY